MSELNRNTPVFAGAAIAASLMLSACRSIDPSEPAQSIVAVTVFEALGDAQPAVAKEMAADLAVALDADPRIEARREDEGSHFSRDYILNGSMYAGGERAFVALQLVDARTAKLVWSRNYDYRGIGADLMAADIRRHLQAYASEN